jgi:hypothetical protein
MSGVFTLFSSSGGREGDCLRFQPLLLRERSRELENPRVQDFDILIRLGFGV